MTATNAPRPRGRPSLTGGRAQTVQTSLSPSQAAWVASRGVPVAAYLRGLVEAEMDEAIQTKGYRPLSSDLDPSVIVKIGGDV